MFWFLDKYLGSITNIFWFLETKNKRLIDRNISCEVPKYFGVVYKNISVNYAKILSILLPKYFGFSQNILSRVNSADTINEYKILAIEVLKT